MKTEEKQLGKAPFENSSLFAILDDGKIEVWVSSDKQINYESLYKTMIEINRKLAGA